MQLNQRINNVLEQNYSVLLYEKVTFSTSEIYKSFSKIIPAGWSAIVQTVDLSHLNSIQPYIKINRTSSNNELMKKLPSDLFCGSGSGDLFNAMPIYEPYIWKDIIFVEIELQTKPMINQIVHVMMKTIYLKENSFSNAVKS